MRFQDVADRVESMIGGGLGSGLTRSLVDQIAQLTIEELGLKISNTGAIVDASGSTANSLEFRQWDPPGGISRPARMYRNGRPVGARRRR